MSVMLKFSRIDNTSWGFRLTGGKDYDMPLTVVKVIEGSIAERTGMIEGDAITVINDHDTSCLTHDEAHDVITKAGNDLVMHIYREYQDQGLTNITDEERLEYGEIPSLDRDICPMTAEVPDSFHIAEQLAQRSLTSSPYFNPTKSYKPFSERPIQGLPILEDPIILSTAYTDDFSTIEKSDFEPDTIFKLDRVVHKAVNIVKTDKKYVEDTSITHKEINLSESEEVVTKNEAETIEEHIDLVAIERSAKEIVEFSIEQAVTVTEEIKNEIEIELAKNQPLWLMTAEYESHLTPIDPLLQEPESKHSESINIEEIESKTVSNNHVIVAEVADVTSTNISETKIEAVGIEIIESNTNETNISEAAEEKHDEKVEFKDTAVEEITDKSILANETSISETADKKVEIKDTQVAETRDMNISTNEKKISAAVEEQHNTKIEVTDTNVSNKTANQYLSVHESNVSTKHITNTAHTLQQINDTTKLIERQSGSHTDQLLKTFFVHLTDVMIALSRMIVADRSRSASPMPHFNKETQTGTIIGSTEEVEKLVESVEQTRRLAETVHQSRKVSMSAEQSQLLAESAEQLRKLSISAEESTKEVSFEELSNEISQVSEMSAVSQDIEQISDVSIAQSLQVMAAESTVASQAIEIEQSEESTVAASTCVSQEMEQKSEESTAVTSAVVSQEIEQITDVSIEQSSHVLSAESTVASQSIAIEQTSRVLSEESTVSASTIVSQETERTSEESIAVSQSTVVASSTASLEVEELSRFSTTVSQNIEVSQSSKPAISELVIEPEIQRQTSEDDSIILVEPPTPLTDEYVFHLDIHVKGLRSRTASPETSVLEPEVPDQEHDLPKPRKPGLSATITTEIETNAYASANKRDETSTLPSEIETMNETTGTVDLVQDSSNVAEFKTIQVSIEPELNDKSIDGTDKGFTNVTERNIEDEVGKPGMTDDDIAVLISGEAEVLKDAHVLGLQRVLASHMNRAKDEEEDDPYSVNFKKIMPQCSFIKDSEVFRALNEEAVKTKEEQKKEERKWTTFLQRPNRPIPRGKPGFVMPDPSEKYQVKIVKQAKPKVAPDHPKSFETGLLPWEERLLNQPPAPPVEIEPPILIPEEGPEYLEALDNLPESAVPDLEDTGIVLPPEPVEEPANLVQQPESDDQGIEDYTETEHLQDSESLLDQTTESNIDILDSMMADMADSNLTMEEQLAQVQAQLLALSQLPAAIQQTLDQVTKQLSKMVPQATIKHQDTTLATTSEDQATDVEQTLTDDERVEDVQQEAAVAQAGEVLVQQQEVAIEEAPKAPEVDPEELERLRVEEHEKVLNQRKMDKQKKELIAELQQEHEQRQVKQRPTPRVPAKPKPAFGPLAPQERPIFLPGGRKWRNPKDAYNDAFISETLTKQAEIITGKTIGDSNCHLVEKGSNEAKRVNFLKYEKPPVSLDHLKESDVYKMVHDMDMPLKAIEKKHTIPIAEEDFREKCRSVTPTTALERQEVYEDHTSMPEQVQP